MTARVGYHMRQHLNAQAAYQAQAASIQQVKEWREVKFEWQTKQTAKAVLFPTYGWVPKSAIAGRTAEGLLVPWAGFHEGQTFLIAEWVFKGRAKS